MHDVFDGEVFADQRDLALRRPGRVYQVFDQPAEAVDLALEDLAQAHQDRVAGFECPQHARRVGDGGERIAQLVREHCQKGALTTLGEAQRLRVFGELLLELLALVNVDGAADVAGKFTAAFVTRDAVVEHPAVFPVVTAQAVVERERLASVDARGVDATNPVDVFRMHQLQPAVTEQLGFSAAGVALPGGID
ncbi:MAG: hypothetical protein M3Z16_04940, partial [Pseudomonadota bacterium]|nr:hypothetical protein [Pseudomonadota bacterium]